MANAFVHSAGDVTARLTDYIVSARWSDLPENVRRETLRSFVNIMGCTIGGARHEVVDLADRTLGEYAGAPHATVIGRGHKADALQCLSDQLSRVQHLLL
jgi:2-methylcitrate dehydratase PrpD